MARNNTSDLSESYLNCLSSIENNISVLYTALADRVTVPSVKVMVSGIAADCQKHSAILKGFGKDVVEYEVKSKKRNKELAEVFDVAYGVYKKIIEKEEIGAEELQSLVVQLVVLQGVLGEKYRFVQSKTSKLVLSESVMLLHGLNLDKLGRMFKKMIGDVEEHRKILGSVKTLVEEKAREETNSAISDGFIVCDPMINQVATPHCGK